MGTREWKVGSSLEWGEIQIGSSKTEVECTHAVTTTRTISPPPLLLSQLGCHILYVHFVHKMFTPQGLSVHIPSNTKKIAMYELNEVSHQQHSASRAFQI